MSADAMRANAVVTLALPIRVQVPDGQRFVTHGYAGPCDLEFTETAAPPRSDGMRGEGIDDGKGTYLRSTAAVRFQIEVSDALPLSHDSVRRLQAELRAIAWDSLQTFLRSYAYVSGHLEGLLVLKPEAWTIDLLDSATGSAADGFPKTTGHLLPGPIALKRTLTPASLAQLASVLQPAAPIPLPDQLLLRAEAEVTLLDDLDHAILDTASALEIFVDQIIEQEIHYAASPAKVRRLGRKVYSAYDQVLRLLGRPSLKDSHPPLPPDDRPLPFELLEFIFSVRNNVIHRGVRQFTLDTLNTRSYRSPYLERHRRFEGIMVDRPEDVVGMVKGAGEIIAWVRSSTPPR